jgi:hypothetical protein
MTRAQVELLLAIAGTLHFLQIPSMRYLSRGALKLATELERLSALNARLMRLFMGAVMLLLLSLGALVALEPAMWLDSVLGRRLLALLTLFWLLRALAQAWLWRLWPRSERALFFALWGLYASLALSYGVAALVAGSASAAQRTPHDTWASP